MARSWSDHLTDCGRRRSSANEPCVESEMAAADVWSAFNRHPTRKRVGKQLPPDDIEVVKKAASAHETVEQLRPVISGRTARRPAPEP